MTAPNINLFFAHLIADYLVRRGIVSFCLAPGSRSAPLAIAAGEQARAKVRVIIDERAAGYFAVGYARATGNPAAVICTSGTAAANLYPAVVEAYHSRLPLILLTADRPEELQRCGANQTIDQRHLFGQFVGGEMTLSAPDDHLEASALLDQLQSLFRSLPAGPIHLNCRFREPLAPEQQSFDSGRLQEQVDRWYAGRNLDAADEIPPDISVAVRDLADRIRRARHGIIVAGPQWPLSKTPNLADLSQALGWPIIADVLSQQRAPDRLNFCRRYDLYLDIPEIADHLPVDLVFHVGGLPTSKRLNEFLRRHKGIEYIKIQDHDRTIDPDHLETVRIVTDPDSLITALTASMKRHPASSDHLQWHEVETRTDESLASIAATSRLTEPAVAAMIGRLIGEEEALYLSNSMPVRDADCFMALHSKDVMVGCNRGVGIDGVLASAGGFAAGCRRPTTLLIGDLALMHDLNSMALVSQSEDPIIVVVLNNNGGGIFHFLPISRFETVFEPYFGTPHNLTFERAAEMFNLPYARPTSGDELAAVYRRARENHQSLVIEIITDRRANVEEHQRLRDGVRRRLTQNQG